LFSVLIVKSPERMLGRQEKMLFDCVAEKLIEK
jgi:hypothetical protein